MMHSKRAIVFLAWGEKYIAEVLNCINKSVLPDYDIILITDQESEAPGEELTMIRAQFKTEGLLRKGELLDFLPQDYGSYLFLDSDTRVIADIELGFVKAEQYGIALAPAPFYSLDYFRGFDRIMEQEGVSRSGQLQYNTGVIFFSLNDETRKVFKLWRDLTRRYLDVIENDQPFFTLALEKAGFNPYALSIGYNYRGLGCKISGIVRIWHSHDEMPENINVFQHNENDWGVRYVSRGELVYHKPQKSAGNDNKLIWLASFPRSGNTMLRTILFHCFGLRSASLYPDDLDGNKNLEKHVGHIEHGLDGKINFPTGSKPLVKTHEHPNDEKPAIYVVRDGRNVCMSMWHFYKKEMSLESIITGRNKFGSWSAHLEAWHPWDRPGTLLLRYEDMVNNLPGVLEQLHRFLEHEVVAGTIPERQDIAAIDGRHVREKNAVRDLPDEYLGLFNLVNGEMMRRLGYYT